MKKVELFFEYWRCGEWVYFASMLLCFKPC